MPATNDTGADAKPSTGAATGTRFVFIDTETTGLDHQRHELTEVSWIVRFEDGTQIERQYFPDHTLDGADESALQITHYHERIASQPTTPAREWLTTFLDDAQGAVLVGAVPDFDSRHLERAARKLQRAPTWDHHLLDVETLALPLIAPGPEAPRSLAATCAALGIPHDRDKAHGALYDARQAMRVFDAVWSKLSELRATAAPLPDPVSRTAAKGNGSDAPPDPTVPRDHDPASGHDGAPDPTVPSDPDPTSGHGDAPRHGGPTGQEASSEARPVPGGTDTAASSS